MFLVLVFLSQVAQAVDTYDFRNRCPGEGGVAERNFSTNPNYLDGRNFPICQCTSYVAFKLNEHWGTGGPQFSNQYYSVTRWGNAYEWINRALDDRVKIGVTGAPDNFTWDENAYNAVFIGDVALWNAWDYVDTASQRRRNTAGHVAFVESFTRDANGDLSCITISDYNMTQYDYSRRTLCRSAPGNAPPSERFPDYFLHIDQDRAYCLRQENRETGSCRTLNAGTRVANGSRQKYIGGIGGSSDPFNLKANRYWVRDVATGTDLDPGTSTVRIGQVIQPRIQVKAKDGDTHDHMRPGKNSIEVDIYVREDLGDWRFLQREYIQATNLPSGATHTEHIDYTVPPGVSTISFKAK
ncbi:MAG: CHAP domain-containing protein, partial [Candidatus Moraniibacteriota bacterium]